MKKLHMETKYADKCQQTSELNKNHSDIVKAPSNSLTYVSAKLQGTIDRQRVAKLMTTSHLRGGHNNSINILNTSKCFALN